VSEIHDHRFSCQGRTRIDDITEDLDDQLTFISTIFLTLMYSYYPLQIKLSNGLCDSDFVNNHIAYILSGMPS
jgi:hypothetical protein